jgi:hypothetical protein
MLRLPIMRAGNCAARSRLHFCGVGIPRSNELRNSRRIFRKIFCGRLCRHRGSASFVICKTDGFGSWLGSFGVERKAEYPGKARVPLVPITVAEIRTARLQPVSFSFRAVSSYVSRTHAMAFPIGSANTLFPCRRRLGFCRSIGSRIGPAVINVGFGIVHHRITTPHGCRVLPLHV